jgi:hypothetical protein
MENITWETLKQKYNSKKKKILNKWGVKMTDLFSSGQGPVAVCCKHSSKPSDSI